MYRIAALSLRRPSVVLLAVVLIAVKGAFGVSQLQTEPRRHGTPLDEALIQGGRTRLRPILMTAPATILALIPLALSGGGGAIIASDLAVVVIGGLLTSTVLTLVVIPVVSKLIVGRQYRRRVVPAEPERKQAGVGV